MSSDLFLFTLFYIVVSLGVVYPPNEFISAGVTIANVFSKYLGSETGNFIQYHIKRSVITLIVHSFLPCVYIISLYLIDESGEFKILWNNDNSYIVQIFVTTAFIAPLMAIYQVCVWSQGNWKEHPISKNLSKFANTNSTWITTASDINVEYRRVDKICIQINSIYKVIATDNWILKITPYNLYCAHQSDAALIVNSCDTHELSPSSKSEVQYINIEVKSSRRDVLPFNIRLNALDFKDLQDKCARPITILPNVVFHKTLIDRFIEVFKEQINHNDKYTTNQEPEQCIGCMQVTSNVKIQKLCVDDNVPEYNCRNCYCRPMWCADCMARWFASRQEDRSPEVWLTSKCTCPICRAQFCIYDVSFVTRSMMAGRRERAKEVWLLKKKRRLHDEKLGKELL